jgi:hypothetical protein
MVYPELLLEAARMLRHMIGEKDKQAYQLSYFLEDAARGVVKEWPPKNYKPVQ